MQQRQGSPPVAELAIGGKKLAQTDTAAGSGGRLRSTAEPVREPAAALAIARAVSPHRYAPGASWCESPGPRLLRRRALQSYTAVPCETMRKRYWMRKCRR